MSVKPGGGAVKAVEAGREGSERTPGPAPPGSAPAAAGEAVAVFPGGSKRWSRYFYRGIAAEVSRVTRYFDGLVQWEPAPHDPGVLFDAIECPHKSVARTLDDFPDLSADRERRTAVLLNANFNYDLDIQATLLRLKPKLARTSRVVVVTYNPYLRWLYALAGALGLRNSPPTVTFLTRTDLEGLARLAGYEVVRLRPVGYSPFRLLGLGHLLNWWMPVVPGLRWTSFVVVALLRPLLRDARRPSLSIVIPARNEQGNIEGALQRMPDLGAERVEIVFVEGHSTDGTWAEIQRVAERYRGPSKSRRSSRRATASATRCASASSAARARCSRSSMPTSRCRPNCSGASTTRTARVCADFVNGSRLLYPMEGEAMRLLNRVGNVFFAKGLSFVLGTRLSDSLCGTKMLARHDYDPVRRLARSTSATSTRSATTSCSSPRAFSGSASSTCRSATARGRYGATSIRRFRHGRMLLKMILLGFFRVRVGPWRVAPVASRPGGDVQPESTGLTTRAWPRSRRRP